MLTLIFTRPVLMSIVSLLPFFCTLLLSQSPAQLPELEPSFTNHFNRENGSGCFEDILVDDMGRLWLIPCKNSRVLNSAALQYYDGYELHNYELKENRGILTGNLRLGGVAKNGSLYGLIDQSIFVSDFDDQNTKLYPIPLPDKGFDRVARITETPQGGFLLLLKSTHIDSMQLWSLQSENFSLQAQVYNPVSTTQQYGLPLLSASHDVWFMSAMSPLYHLNDGNRSGDPVDIFRFDTLINPLSLVGSNQEVPELVQQGNKDLFLFLPAAGQNYFLGLRKNIQQWQKVDFHMSKNWRPRHIFKDPKGNICFLFEDEGGESRVILRDTTGHLWDYTPMVEGKGEISGMASPDFFQRTYVVSDEGVYCAAVKSSSGINTILSDHWISSMAEMPNGEILINTIDSGWKIFNPKSSLIHPFRGPGCDINTPPFGAGMKQQIIKDKKGYLWFLSGQHLIRYDPDSNKCYGFFLDNNYDLFVFLDNDLVALSRQNHILDFYNIKKGEFENPISNLSRNLEGRIRDLFFSDHQSLWIPTNRGLYKIDFQEKTNEIIGLDGSFGDVRFTSIRESPDGKLWLGTYYNGVIIYDKDTQEKTLVNTSHGLSGDAVMGMITDLSGDVWVSTENGISILSSEGEILGELHEEDGLSYDVFERFDPFRDRNGTLYFGNSKGISIIDPVRVKEEFRNPGSVKIYLTNVSYYNSLEKNQISITSGFGNLHQLEIPAGRRSLKINFALSENVNPSSNHFAYKLQGRDQEWTFIGGQRKLDFDNLPSGEYNLLIRGSNHQHHWSNNTLVIPLRVGEYFYKTYWFYMIILGFLSVIALIWIRYLHFQQVKLKSEVKRRTRQIRRDKETIEQQATDLKKLDELKTSFFSNISHELRTPITLIKTPVDHILNAYSKQVKQEIRNLLMNVQSNADRLMNMVNGYLELSKLELGKPQINPAVVNIEHIIQHLIQSFHFAAKSKGVHLKFTSRSAMSHWIKIDEGRFKIIMNNLLSNAVKYTERGGQVEVLVDVRSGTGDKSNFVATGDAVPSELTVKVIDTGQGISPESLPFIFDRYYRVPKDTNDETGSGIGLALAQELASLMGGDITVESAPGRGSTFTLSLPTATDPNKSKVPKDVSLVKYNEKAENLAAHYESSRETYEGKILLVEDDPEIRVLIQTVLDNSFQVEFSNHGQGALNWLRHQGTKDIDLIIADLMMPVMDGMELLREIKKHERWKKYPFLMLTAKTSEKSKLEALRMGVDDYLTKPFSSDELKIRARNLIKNSQKRKAFEKQRQVIMEVEFGSEDKASDSWLTGVESAIKKALDLGQDCSVGSLAKKVNLSERQMNRRIKTMTGMSVGHYIREVKLYKARHLLESKAYATIAEVAYACGFNTPKYFSRLFCDRFGKHPGEYLK